MGRVPVAGPASKVEEAAEKVEQVIRIDNGKEEASSPVRLPSQNQYGLYDQAGQYAQTGQYVPYEQAGGLYDQQTGGRPITVALTTTMSETGEIYHENIEQSKEFQHLSELKEVASEHARSEAIGLGIPRGSTAAIARRFSIAIKNYMYTILDVLKMPLVL